MLEKYEVCCALFHGFDWPKWTVGNAQGQLNLLPTGQEHVLAQDNGKERYLNAVRELSQAFALAVPHPETFRIRDDVGFFQAVRVALSKRAAGEARPEEELDLAVRQIISRAVASEGVMDIFAAAGLDRPDISVLSEEFLAEVQRNAPTQPRRGATAEAAQGRDIRPTAQERGAGPLVRRDAGADAAALPEPGHRGGAGYRGADPAREGDAGGRRQG